MAQKEDWKGAVLPYAKDHGCATFGAIGTCWGSYMVVRMAADPLVSAGVSMHPSHPNIIPQMGEDEEEILSKIQVHLLVNKFFFVFRKSVQYVSHNFVC